MNMRLKNGFRHNFIHPKWLSSETEFNGMPEPQKGRINLFLGTFLEIGRFIKLQKELKELVRKFNVNRRHIPLGDISNVNSWPLFIATLTDLAEKSQ